jgi:cell division protein ZapA (FtsZ GTPase activity inhibitor)
MLHVLLSFWLPIASAAALIIKTWLGIRKWYRQTKSDISEWTNTLLDNHMAHIQTAAEEASVSLREMSETNKELSTTMREMRSDFQEAQTENIRVQNAILTGIEVLKSRG